MPISAGPRTFQVRTAEEAGRAFYVDLSGLPAEQRPAIVAEIRDLIDRAISRASAAGTIPNETSS